MRQQHHVPNRLSMMCSRSELFTGATANGNGVARFHNQETAAQPLSLDSRSPVACGVTRGIEASHTARNGLWQNHLIPGHPLCTSIIAPAR
jgi:hypothetical protein